MEAVAEQPKPPFSSQRTTLAVIPKSSYLRPQSAENSLLPKMPRRRVPVSSLVAPRSKLTLKMSAKISSFPTLWCQWRTFQNIWPSLMVHQQRAQWGSQYRRLHPALPSLWEPEQESQSWSSRSSRPRPRAGSTAIASKASVDSCTVCASSKDLPAIHSCVSALVAKMVSQNKLIWPESSKWRKWRALWEGDATVRRITAWRTTASVKQLDCCVIRPSVRACAATITRQDHPNKLWVLPASNHKSLEIHLSTVKRCMLE